MVMAVGVVMGLHACFEIFVSGVEINMADHYGPICPSPCSTSSRWRWATSACATSSLSISSPICNSSGALVAIATIAMSGIGDMNAWQLAAIALVAVGVVALGITEATEDDELRAARQQASNHKYAKSLLALLLPIAYCILDAAGTFADSLVLETLNEDSANVAYELTFLAAGLVCGAYVLFVKREKLTPRTEAPKYIGAVCETIGQFFYIYALADSAHVAMSAPIISSYCAASVLWSRIFLKEKLSVKHYISILMVFIGIVIMGVFDM